jgi:hypothetical protein
MVHMKRVIYEQHRLSYFLSEQEINRNKNRKKKQRATELKIKQTNKTSSAANMAENRTGPTFFSERAP